MMNSVADDITRCAMEIEHQITETGDDFIVKTVSRFMEQEHIESKIVLSKKILCRALEWYVHEHTDEYTQLLEECQERMAHEVQ